MTYRTIYDVQDDSVVAGHTAGLAFLGFAIFWTVLWFLIHRYVRGMPPERRRNSWKGLLVGGFLILIGAIIVGTTTVPAFRDQWQCRKWLQSGDYQISTGAVTELRHEAGKNAPWHFRVGDTKFTYWVINSPIAGFRGDLTAPVQDLSKLRDGLPLRIAHRESRILRIEIANESSTVAVTPAAGK